jgi:hypothetical protein
VPGPFAQSLFRFTTGVRAGELAHIRDENDRVLLTYRSFASVVGIVAGLVAGIVLAAGFAAVVFLAAERSPVRAGIALALTLVFAFVIGLLVPRTSVTLYDDSHPALTIAQQSVFPTASYVVTTPNGATLGALRKSFLSRLGRNRWTIWQDGRYVGDAREESLGRAIRRKLLGKFSRSSEANVHIEFGGLAAGRVIRRPDDEGRTDLLLVEHDAIDRRVAVALATVILGREP